MSKSAAPTSESRIIGNIAKPPFVRLPDPIDLFARRAARFSQLAPGNPLGPYLQFLAGLSRVQAQVQEDLPEPAMPAVEALKRAQEHAMPPLDRNGFAADPAFDSLFSRLIAAMAEVNMPPEGREALGAVGEADADQRAVLISNVLSDSIPFEAIAEHTFAAAVLQVHFARQAARLDAAALKPVGDGVCPSCGGAPTCSLVVGWANAEGTRFCSCSLCGTLWNYVRAKCTLCGSTKEISFQQVKDGQGTIKAECCGSCRGYVKVLYHDKDSSLDPVADDVATLGIDLLVRELDFRRGAINPFLTGY